MASVSLPEFSLTPKQNVIEWESRIEFYDDKFAQVVKKVDMTSCNAMSHEQRVKCIGQYFTSMKTTLHHIQLTIIRRIQIPSGNLIIILNCDWNGILRLRLGEGAWFSLLLCNLCCCVSVRPPQTKLCFYLRFSCIMNCSGKKRKTRKKNLTKMACYGCWLTRKSKRSAHGFIQVH